jgi:hypothetical protein
MHLVSALEHGGRDFVDAIQEAADTDGRRTPPAGGWSAVEIVEHVVVFEERYLEWITNGSEPAPPRDHDRELRLFSRIRSRLQKLETPEIFLPCGRYGNLAQAMVGFQSARARTISRVHERGDRIYGVGVQHPYFGLVNGGELVQLMDGHARRHADQIRELCETLATIYPSRR